MPAARPAKKALTSKLLVVDASVMRAAGGEEATDPAPAHARDALKAILTICHRVCLSMELRAEWKRHRSRFAWRWWRQMYATRKVVDCEPPSCAAILDDIRSFPSITRSEIDAVEKDIHLIAVALAADQTVLSWDSRVAAVIRKVCADRRTVTSRAVAHVLWVNPIIDKDPLRAWLSETGPAQPHWRLGIAAIPTAKARRSRHRT
jgi:hypothetical protein